MGREREKNWGGERERGGERDWGGERKRERETGVGGERKGERNWEERELKLELKLENFILEDCSLGSVKNLSNN